MISHKNSRNSNFYFFFSLYNLEIDTVENWEYLQFPTSTLSRVEVDELKAVHNQETSYIWLYLKLREVVDLLAKLKIHCCGNPRHSTILFDARTNENFEDYFFFFSYFGRCE